MKSAISFLYLKLFIIIFLLSNCTAINTVNESFQGLVKNNNSSTNGSSSYSYYDCYNDVKKCKDNQLCQIKPSNNDYFKYREEAEIRGLSCNTVANQLKTYGRTKRGWLGVLIQEISKEIADSLEMKSAKGALVSSATEGGPAFKAGVKTGDVIIKFNDIIIDNMKELPKVVASTPVGKSVPLVIWRNGKTITLNVVLVELELAEKDNLILSIDNTTQSGKNTNSIDKMLKYALNRLIQLNISSKIEVEKKENILKKMNINEFNTFYKLCKNAFAESEPLKCDIALKNLN